VIADLFEARRLMVTAKAHLMEAPESHVRCALEDLISAMRILVARVEEQQYNLESRVDRIEGV
jgi:hypothetical protein